MPTFQPVTTGWINVNMNDHHINSQPRNTESSAPLVLMLVSPTVRVSDSMCFLDLKPEFTSVSKHGSRWRG